MVRAQKRGERMGEAAARSLQRSQMGGRGRIEILGAREVHGAIDLGAAAGRAEMRAERAALYLAGMGGFGEQCREANAAIGVERGDLHGVQGEDEGGPLESCRACLFGAGAGLHGEGGVTARVHDRARLDGGARAAAIHIDGLDTADTVALCELGVEARFERRAFAGERIGDGGEAGRRVRQHVEPAAAHRPRRGAGTHEARGELARQPPMRGHRARLAPQTVQPADRMDQRGHGHAAERAVTLDQHGVRARARRRHRRSRDPRRHHRGPARRISWFYRIGADRIEAE